MSDANSGPVDNGARLPVQFPFFKGVAGVRLFGDGGQLSCIAAMPPRSKATGGTVDGKAIAGTVDGRAAEVDMVRRSSVAAGMIVASFRFVDA